MQYIRDFIKLEDEKMYVQQIAEVLEKVEALKKNR